MKTIPICLLAGLLAACLFSGCKKDDDAFEGLRVTIDGKTWQPSLTTGALFAGSINLTASEADGSKTLLIALPANAGPGAVYDLAAGNEVSGTYSGGPTSVFTFIAGKVTVTEHDTAGKRIKGSFELEGENPFTNGKENFSDGEFNIKYQ